MKAPPLESSALAGLAALRAAVVSAFPSPAMAGLPVGTSPWIRPVARMEAATTAGTGPVSVSVPRSTGAPVGTPPEPTMSDTAPEIVSRARAGDAEAFGELYDQYVGFVYRYIYYRVGSVALAEDLASETFVRALRRLPSFQWQGRDFGAWLVTIARNLVADHYKSGRYRLEVTTEDLVAASRGATTEGPEREVLESITNDTLLAAVKRLGAEQQECIVLRFLQGLSVAETALAMGKNEGAIKALQYRAVRTLGRMLPPDLAE